MGAGNACLFLLKVPQRQITSGEAGAFDAGLQRLSGLPGFGDKTSPKPAIEGAFTPAAGSSPGPCGPGPRLQEDHPSGPPRPPAACHTEQLGPASRALRAWGLEMLLHP